jgi:hypothetical protein
MIPIAGDIAVSWKTLGVITPGFRVAMVGL